MFRVAHVRAGQQTYVIAGMTTADQFARADPSFLTAIRSFRELSQQEADRIQPSRLTFYDVRFGRHVGVHRGPCRNRDRAQARDARHHERQ
jgi:predicted Zn-dependent protease